MTVFDKAWSVVKGREPCSKCDDVDKELYCHGCGRCSDCCPDWEGHGRGGVVKASSCKEAPTDECKGCGLAHGSPNSEYCSEICERQNMKKSDDPLGDALKNARNTPRKQFSQKEIEAMLGRRVLPPRKDPEDDPLVHRARKNLMEEKQRRGQ